MSAAPRREGAVCKGTSSKKLSHQQQCLDAVWHCTNAVAHLLSHHLLAKLQPPVLQWIVFLEVTDQEILIETPTYQALLSYMQSASISKAVLWKVISFCGGFWYCKIWFNFKLEWNLNFNIFPWKGKPLGHCISGRLLNKGGCWKSSVSHPRAFHVTGRTGTREPESHRVSHFPRQLQGCKLQSIIPQQSTWWSLESLVL